MSEIKFTNQTNFYQGKVRNVYTIADKWLVAIASNRISAFDVILPKEIPYKGQVLNLVAAKMLKLSEDICPSWLMATPAPNVSVGLKCIPFKIEMVVRGNLVGHAWRTYSSGNKTLCGVRMEEGLRENDFFKTPIITPSTKAAVGHDEDISAKEIIEKKLATEEEWETISNYALSLFRFGQAFAKKQGLILADTKYEFGILNNKIYLLDEIHTPDSSRYFYADDFEKNQKLGLKQKQLSKEFVREWLIENNFMGKQGQTLPKMTEENVQMISKRYIELYEKLLGEKFIPSDMSTTETINAVEQCLTALK